MRRPLEPTATQAGLTLLELLVTAGLLSLLMGLGVGFMRRSDGLPEARSAIVGQLRMAALDARTRGLPTEVVFEPGVDGALSRVWAKALDPVALVTFDPGQRHLDADMLPVLGGQEAAQGRIGRGRTVAEGDVSPALRMQMSRQRVDFRDGFAFRIDVLLQDRAPGTLLRLGNCLVVALDDEGRPTARFATEGDEGRGGPAVNLAAAGGLPFLRWSSLEIAGDGETAWIAVDGAVLAERPMKERLRQDKGDVLECLPAQEPAPCTIDEVQVFAYFQSPPQPLPDGVQVEKAARVRFDVRGEPVSPPDILLRMQSDGRLETLRIGEGGVLR